MIKRQPRGCALMYYSHVMWLHVFDVTPRFLTLELSVSLITSAETRFCAPADGEIFPECKSALRSRLKLLDYLRQFGTIAKLMSAFFHFRRFSPPGTEIVVSRCFFCRENLVSFSSAALSSYGFFASLRGLPATTQAEHAVDDVT